jgi:hypothetical protein
MSIANVSRSPLADTRSPSRGLMPGSAATLKRSSRAVPNVPAASTTWCVRTVRCAGPSSGSVPWPRRAPSWTS